MLRLLAATSALLLCAATVTTSAFAEKSVFDETVVEKENWEPAIPRPEQEKVAAAKLKDFEQRYGKKPNILIFLVDDMGWGDPGVYGVRRLPGLMTLSQNCSLFPEDGMTIRSIAYPSSWAGSHAGRFSQPLLAVVSSLLVIPNTREAGVGLDRTTCSPRRLQIL